jgi:hypothetical protein
VATIDDILADALSRVRENVHDVLGRLDDAQLVAEPAPGANTVAWLVWHLTRVLDGHLAEVVQKPEVWTDGGWAERFALPFDDSASGYGMTPEEVRQVRASGELLGGYFDATYDMASGVLRGLGDGDYDRVVDERWDPPVTLAVRLVSVIDDAAQHVGQAGYAAGILLGR